MNPRQKRDIIAKLILLVVAPAVPLGLLLVGTLFLRNVGPPMVRPIPFESAEWKRAEGIGNGRTVRSQMVDDLLDRHDFKGKTREQVVALLGEPDRAPRNDFRPPNHPALVYALGLERAGPFSVDFEYLAFRLDGQKRVVELAVTVD